MTTPLWRGTLAGRGGAAASLLSERRAPGRGCCSAMRALHAGRARRLSACRLALRHACRPCTARCARWCPCLRASSRERSAAQWYSACLPGASASSGLLSCGSPLGHMAPCEKSCPSLAATRKPNGMAAAANRAARPRGGGAARGPRRSSAWPPPPLAPCSTARMPAPAPPQLRRHVCARDGGSGHWRGGDHGPRGHQPGAHLHRVSPALRCARCACHSVAACLLRLALFILA